MIDEPNKFPKRKMDVVHLLFAVLVCLTFFFACGDLEDPTTTEELNPPLGLRLTKINEADGTKNVDIEWWGANQEQNFDGYIIYVAEKAEVELVETTKSALNHQETKSLPTVKASDTSEIDRNSPISYNISSEQLIEKFNQSTGFELYIIVKAHSSTNKLSERSNEIKVSL